MVSIDIEVYYMLQEKRINTSKIVNDYLREYLKIKDDEKKSLLVLEKETGKAMAKALRLKAQLERQKKEDAKWI